MKILLVNAGFTREDFQHLLRYVRELPPAQVTFTVYTPSPGSKAWYHEREHYVCHPYDLHDCMHPLTPTSMPLREFYRHFSSLSSGGSARNPLRSPRNRLPIRDILKVVMTAATYSRALRRAYRDFPPHLRDTRGSQAASLGEAGELFCEDAGTLETHDG